MAVTLQCLEFEGTLLFYCSFRCCTGGEVVQRRKSRSNPLNLARNVCFKYNTSYVTAHPITESHYSINLVFFFLSKLSWLKVDFFFNCGGKESPRTTCWPTAHCASTPIFAPYISPQPAGFPPPPFLNLWCAHTADITVLHPLCAPCPLAWLEPTAPGFRPSKKTVDKRDLCPETTRRAPLTRRPRFCRGRGANKRQQ